MVVKCSIIPMIDQGPICSLTKHPEEGSNTETVVYLYYH